MSLSMFYQINKRYYIKKDTAKLKKIIKLIGLCFSLTGLFFSIYFFFPLLSWKFYLEPVFASQTFVSPIPKTATVTKDYIQSLWLNTARSVQTLYDPNARNWLPGSQYKEAEIVSQLSYYFISIPKLNIQNAVVSTVDTDLSTHLVNFPGTAIPPAKGNAAVFGHSSLPPLFDPKNYKTIFSTVHTLVIGDSILVTANNLTYKYKIYSISIVEATDTSFLSEDGNESYLTIVTCTPPGTTWKRLIIRSRLEKI